MKIVDASTLIARDRVRNPPVGVTVKFRSKEKLWVVDFSATGGRKAALLPDAELQLWEAPAGTNSWEEGVVQRSRSQMSMRSPSPGMH